MGHGAQSQEGRKQGHDGLGVGHSRWRGCCCKGASVTQGASPGPPACNTAQSTGRGQHTTAQEGTRRNRGTAAPSAPQHSVSYRIAAYSTVAQHSEAQQSSRSQNSQTRAQARPPPLATTAPTLPTLPPTPPPTPPTPYTYTPARPLHYPPTHPSNPQSPPDPPPHPHTHTHPDTSHFRARELHAHQRHMRTHIHPTTTTRCPSWFASPGPHPDPGNPRRYPAPHATTQAGGRTTPVQRCRTMHSKHHMCHTASRTPSR